MNMLNEYIMGCNGQVTFDNNALTLFNTVRDEDGESVVFTDIFTFNREDGGLFLTTTIRTASGTELEAFGPDIVSRNVTGFTVTSERSGSYFDTIAVTLSFSPTNIHDNRTYTATHLITLRNSPEITIIREEEPPDDEE
jgi:hypothetical protein